MSGINLFDHGQALYFSKSLIRVERGATIRNLGLTTTLWVKSVTITNNIPDSSGNITETIYVYQRVSFDPSIFFGKSTTKKRDSYPTCINVTIAPDNEDHGEGREVKFIEAQPINEKNFINISLNERFGADIDMMLFGAPPTLGDGGFYSLEISEKISLPDWHIEYKKGITGYGQTFACDYDIDFNYYFPNPAAFDHKRSKVSIDVNLLGNGSLSDPGSGAIKLAHLAIWRVKRNPTTTHPIKKFQTGIVVNLTSSSIDPQFRGDIVKHKDAETFAGIFSWNYDGEIK